MASVRLPTARILTVLSLASLSPQAALRAQEREPQSLEARVGSLLREADNGSLEFAWQVGRKLGEIEGQDEAVAKAVIAATSKAGNHGRLAAARALADIAEGETYGKEILDTLAPVAKGDDTAARAAALGLLGNGATFNRKVLPAVQQLLHDNATSELADPLVRVAACRALWSVGAEEHKRTVRGVLAQFLQSSERALRIQGALALAEINTDSFGPGWDVLREIAHEPTPEGRLASSYLRLERERRQFESMLRTLTEQSGRGANDSFRALKEIITRVQLQHLQGDKLGNEFLMTAAAKGILDSLDRHSSFFTSEEFQRFFFDLNREYGGIGAFVNFDRDEVFSIVRPIYSGPAYRAGLRSGDKILEVDGWETAGHTSDEIIARLKGKPGTPVTIKLYRAGLLEPQDVTILREAIRVPAVDYDLLPGEVGYIELITFASNSTDELKKALLDLEKRGAKSIVLDVRNNTGGFLEEARDIVELFVPGEQLVVYTQGRDMPRDEYKTRNRQACDLPLAILINEYSASASEIVAGALQEMKRAVIVGKRSYGKGSVQNLIPLRSMPGEEFTDQNDNHRHDEWEPFVDANDNKKYDVGPRLKLTVSRYHLPSGRSPNKEFDTLGKVTNPDWGVIPDVEAEVRELDVNEAWKNAELFELVKKDVFHQYVKQRVAENKDLFTQLALGDGGDPQRYPDFDTFHASLHTKLDKDDVRRWLRYAIRDAVADLRGKAFPGNRALGDHQEDGQLQEAVRNLLQKLGKDIKEVREYQGVLKTAQAAK
jgi:carboxyl-terminal processing protease